MKKSEEPIMKPLEEDYINTDRDVIKKSWIDKIPVPIKVGFFRWWFSAAVYFFIAWGTNLATVCQSLDFIFFLGLLIGVGMIIIFNPVVYGMFGVKRRGKIARKKYTDRNVFEGSLMMLGEIFKCIISTWLVSLVYIGINLLFINVFGYPNDQVVFSGEPILFGIFFMIFYCLITFIHWKIVDLVEYIKSKRKTKHA